MRIEYTRGFKSEVDDSTRYFSVMHRDSDGKIRHDLNVSYKVEQYAVLDLIDMICEWVDAESLHGTDLHIHGFNRLPTFKGIRRLEGDNISYTRRTECYVRLLLYGSRHDFWVDKSYGLYYNGSNLISVTGGLQLDSILLLNSGEGVFRLDLSVGVPLYSDIISFWIDAETQGLLGYNYNNTEYVMVGESDLARGKFKRLLSRSAKSAMLGGGRLY